MLNTYSNNYVESNNHAFHQFADQLAYVSSYYHKVKDKIPANTDPIEKIKSILVNETSSLLEINANLIYFKLDKVENKVDKFNLKLDINGHKAINVDFDIKDIFTGNLLRKSIFSSDGLISNVAKLACKTFYNNMCNTIDKTLQRFSWSNSKSNQDEKFDVTTSNLPSTETAMHNLVSETMKLEMQSKYPTYNHENVIPVVNRGAVIGFTDMTKFRETNDINYINVLNTESEFLKMSKEQLEHKKVLALKQQEQALGHNLIGSNYRMK